jgi:hypothetical protein
MLSGTVRRGHATSPTYRSRKTAAPAGCGNVGMGWEKIYETLEVVERPPTAIGEAPRSIKGVGGFAAQVAEHVQRHAALGATAATSPAYHKIEVTGHSLGSALATLYAAENALTDIL